MLKMQSSARRKAYITAMKLLMGVAAVLTCALVVGMIGYILGNGIPNITWEMLSTAPSYLANRVGILPDILSTLYIVIATLLIVLPLGVGAAIYLNEYAANKKLVSIIEYASETLSGIPSIIYGLVGMLIFCKNGTSLLAGALTLTIMNLPTIAHDTGEPQDRTAELPRGRVRPGRGQMAHHPHGGAAKLRGRYRDGLYPVDRTHPRRVGGALIHGGLGAHALQLL